MIETYKNHLKFFLQKRRKITKEKNLPKLLYQSYRDNLMREMKFYRNLI